MIVEREVTGLHRISSPPSSSFKLIFHSYFSDALGSKSLFIREQGVHWSSPQHFLARTEKFPVYSIVWLVLYYNRSPGGIYQNSSSQPHIQQFHWFIKLDQILKKTLKILIGMVSIWKKDGKFLKVWKFLKRLINSLKDWKFLKRLIDSLKDWKFLKRLKVP